MGNEVVKSKKFDKIINDIDLKELQNYSMEYLIVKN